TSCPMRGRKKAPHFLPAQFWVTRIQQLEVSSAAGSGSHGNFALTRPYLSTQISSPALPTMTAACGPCTVGFGVTRAGRKGMVAGMAVICDWKVADDEPLPPPDPISSFVSWYVAE